MAIKHSNPYTGSYLYKLSSVFFGMYAAFGIPSILVCTYIAYTAKGRGNKDAIFWLPIYSSILIISLLTILYVTYKQRKHIALFLNHFKKVEAFSPLKSCECNTLFGTNYAGLDIDKGVLLIIAHTESGLRNLLAPKDIVVMGFDVNSFKSAELSGQKLTIYTGKPDIPFLVISHRKMPALFESLSAMRNRPYVYDNSFPGYVNHCAKRIADENNLNLVMSRFN